MKLFMVKCKCLYDFFDCFNIYYLLDYLMFEDCLVIYYDIILKVLCVNYF